MEINEQYNNLIQQPHNRETGHFSYNIIIIIYFNIADYRNVFAATCDQLLTDEDTCYI